MSSAGSHLSLLDIFVHSAGKLCEGELCCFDHRSWSNALCLLYKIYYRANHPLHEHQHHFVATRNTRASAALEELALEIPRGRTDHS